ncbi:MAG: peptidoglycan DD-metalloendopeptidase family protein [Candidatus Undinarchaeales archaeon]|jgi:hypothetical protein|nr:peptidoglycan DD-metalloendopeptidase family protein [Candidatus Undinarchaeales archaeon]MDP7493713.1 peptidoglycan DD-metalloendopeptidase family protein [Candidatus Undinarchaeales archaeon]
MKRSSALCVLLVLALVLASVIAGDQRLDIEDGYAQGELKKAKDGVEEVETTEIGGLALDAIGSSGASAPYISNLAIPCTGQEFDNMADYLDAMAGAYEQMVQHYSTISTNMVVAQDGFIQQCWICNKAIEQVKGLGLDSCDPRLGGEGLTAMKVASEGLGPALCDQAAGRRCEVKGLDECRPDEGREVGGGEDEATGSGSGSGADQGTGTGTGDGESTQSGSGGGKLVEPLRGTSQSQWKTYGAAGRHRGIDIHVPAGTATYAVADGTLVYSERGHTKWTTPPDTPNSVLLKFDKPLKYKGKTYYFAWYTHMKSLAFHVPDGSGGKHVTAGTNLGAVGLGNKVPHLHFAILIARPQGPGQYMDPLDIKAYYSGGGGSTAGQTEDPSEGEQGAFGCQGGDMGKLGSSSLGACAPYMKTVERYMAKHGLNGRVDPLQIAALMMQESSCNPSVNCGGIMQVDHPCRVDKSSPLYCACKGNADLGIDLGLKELAANLNKAGSLGASSSEALSFVQFGYNRGMGAMETAINYRKGGASSFDSMMRSCEKYYGAGTKWNNANYYCRKRGHGPYYPELVQERFEQACRDIGGTPGSGGPAFQHSTGSAPELKESKSVEEAAECPLCAAVPCAFASACEIGDPSEGEKCDTKDACGEVLRFKKDEEKGTYECVVKPGEEGDCCIREKATCPSKCNGDCKIANATVVAASARSVITAPSMLLACQRAMSDLWDACAVGSSDVLGGITLDPCTMAERTGRGQAALDQRTAAISAVARQLRLLAGDVRSSMRTGAPPPGLEQHVNDLVGMLEKGGQGGNSVTEFQYELTALVTLAGDPLIRDVSTPGMARNSDSIGYTGVNIGPISLNVPMSSNRRYDVDDSSTGQNGDRDDVGIIVSNELLSANVSYRGSGVWGDFCGRYNVKDRTTVAKERAAGGSSSSSGGSKGVPELRQLVRRITSDAPVAGCGRPTGRCESELEEGVELLDVNVDAWSSGHVAALMNLARLDPDKLFMDMQDCFRYKTRRPPTAPNDAQLSPGQCQEACQLCFGTTGSHCHPELSLCVCHTGSGHHLIDMNCPINWDQEALELARQCCAPEGTEGTAGQLGAVPPARSSYQPMSGPTSGASVCQSPYGAAGMTYDVCVGTTSETGLCCLEGLTERPVGKIECEPREVPCDEACLDQHKDNSTAARKCIKKCNMGNVTATPTPTPSPTPSPTPNATVTPSPTPNATVSPTPMPSVMPTPTPEPEDELNDTLECKRDCLAGNETDVRGALDCMRTCDPSNSTCEDTCARERPDPVLLRPCLEACVGLGDGETDIICEEGCVIKFGAGSGDARTCMRKCDDVQVACEERCLGEDDVDIQHTCLVDCGRDPACVTDCGIRFPEDRNARDGCFKGCDPANATIACMENCTSSGGNEKECAKLCKAVSPEVTVSEVALLRGSEETRTFYANESVRVRAVVNNTGDYSFTGRAVARLRVIGECDCPPCPDTYECGCACEEEVIELRDVPIRPLAPGDSWAYISDPIQLEPWMANATVQLELDVVDDEGEGVATAAGPLTHVVEMGEVSVTHGAFVSTDSDEEVTDGNPGMEVVGRLVVTTQMFPVSVETYAVIGASQELAGTRAARTIDAPGEELVVETAPFQLTGDLLGWVLHIGVRVTGGDGSVLLDTVLDEQGFDPERCTGRVMTSWCVGERSRVMLGYPRAYLEVKRPQLRIAEAVFRDADGRPITTAVLRQPVSFEIDVRNLAHVPFSGSVEVAPRLEDGMDVIGGLVQQDLSELARGGTVTLRSSVFGAFGDPEGGSAMGLHVTATDGDGSLWIDDDADPTLFPNARVIQEKEIEFDDTARQTIDATFDLGGCRLEVVCEDCLSTCELHIDNNDCTLETRSCGCTCAPRRR